MAGDALNATIEGFVTDLAFVDQSKNVSDMFPTSTANVAELSSNALSYFSSPASLVDKRIPTDRSVNWAAQTRPRVTIDEVVYPTFMATMASLPIETFNQLFRIVDKLIFNFRPNETHEEVEELLATGADTKNVYVAGSYTISSTIITDTVYVDGAAPKIVSVPAYATFDITVPSGATTKTYSVKFYASIASFLTNYSQSTIVEVIPPLPYAQLFDSSLSTSIDNIFATAATTAELSFTNLESRLRNTLVSGMKEFKAVLTDSSNTIAVPFNILYNGRTPTLFEIRNAIKNELLTSGIGDETTWKRRIPGVFVSGRFYVVPMWDYTFQKPDQKIFPNVLNFNSVLATTDRILSTLGYSNISENLDVISIYYNHMSATVVPDQSGAVDVKRLGEVLPDYQSFSSSDEQFAYMEETTQAFTRELNAVLAVATQAQTSNVYGPNTEGVLSFYSYTAGNYEVCVITKSCYETILESEQ
jgi:hypothetical protein